jgi:Beta-catenin-interacting protein ICAT
VKAETLEQLRDFQATLKKMMVGDVTLVDQFGSVQLAIQAAISEAFSTPEVIGMFARKQPGQLRERLTDLQREVKLGKISRDTVTTQAVEILAALQKLGEPLTPHEIAFLQKHQSASLRSFAQNPAQLGRCITSSFL